MSFTARTFFDTRKSVLAGLIYDLLRNVGGGGVDWNVCIGAFWRKTENQEGVTYIFYTFLKYSCLSSKIFRYFSKMGKFEEVRKVFLRI